MALTSRLRLLLIGFEPGYRAARLGWVLARYAARRPHEADFRAFRHLQDRAGLFLDVGANAGQSALSFRLFHRAPILSVEPNRYHEPDLRLVRHLVGDFDYVMCGAGDVNGTFSLHVPVFRGTPLTGEASLCRDDAGRVWLARHAGVDCSADLRLAEQIVEVRVLDELHLAPAFVKIDVEGFELNVLRGLARTVARHRPVILLERNDGFAGVCRHLDEADYRPFRYDPAGDALVPYDGDAVTNVFFLPTGDPAVRGKAVSPSRRA